MHSQDRKTKIVCTIGPATRSLENIEKLFLAGMNVARLNFSHGSHEDHRQTIEWVREVARKYRYSITVLMDLQGPKIRVGTMKDGVQCLVEGTQVKITSEQVEEPLGSRCREPPAARTAARKG